MRVFLSVFAVGLTCCVGLSQARIGTFWHVSDFHLDTNYSTTGDPTAMCWKKARSSPNPRPVQGRTTNPGHFGHYLCDAPMTLIESAVHAMKNIHANPDFIMWTGDDTAHVDDKYFSTDKVFGIIAQITHVLNESFPNTAFLPVLGNHDYYKKNQLPPGPSDLQTYVADLWWQWLEEFGAYDSFNSSGRYLAEIPGSSVSVLALNTLIWYKSNNETALDNNAEDPDGQFSWADSQLSAMKAAGRKVYIMGHIPPGSFERYQQKTEGFHWYQERYNERFIKLIQDHADIIEAQFFAHHHTDSFRLFFKDNNRGDSAVPISYQLLTPGVSPWKSTLSEETGANNPGIRLISYDTVTGKIKEVTTYYLNLTKANTEGKDNWEREYNFTNYYNLVEISPGSLFNLTRKMKNDPSLFSKYYSANTLKYEDPSVCTARCKKLHWCAITEIDYDRFHSCNSATSTVPWAISVVLVLAGLSRMVQ